MPRPNVPVKIIVHHTADSSAGPQFDKVDEYHKQRGFYRSSMGYYVGYHYLIERDGSVRQAKEDHEEGCHTIGENISSLGICLSGNFDIELPSQEQIDALGRLMVSKIAQLNIAEEAVFPHRKYAIKDCYGTRLTDIWARCVLLYQRCHGFETLAPALLPMARELVKSAMK